MKESEKQKWMEMNRAQRKQYFLDYYMFPVSVSAVILFIVCFLTWHFFLKPQTEAVLYAAVVDDSLDEDRLAQAVTDMTSILGADGKNRTVHIDDSFYIKDGALDKIQVYLYNKQLDVMILDEEVFQEYAGYGFFQSLDEVLSETDREKYKDRYLYAAGYKDTDDVSFEDNETGQGEKMPYGLSLEGDNRFTEMSQYIEHPVFTIAAGSGNVANGLKFLEYLMSA